MYAMDIKTSTLDKTELLRYFRLRSKEIMSELDSKYSTKDFKEKSRAFNKAIVETRDNLSQIVFSTAMEENWRKNELLSLQLLIFYTSGVVMLEERNEIWQYDYMSFSRRIGELWEPFCKICFKYSISNIKQFVPPLFSDVKLKLTSEIEEYVDSLNLTDLQKAQLKDYFAKVWSLVSSGEIKLELDLHFIEGMTHYVADFKSGFGSNEKGNTNRLLLVGTIYRNIIGDEYNCVMFVRSDKNNNYLNTLRNSGVWNVYCGDEAYGQIEKFTSFNLKKWISENVDWQKDFSAEMSSFVEEHNLSQYLIW